MIDQPLPGAVEALDVLLDDRFLRHEAHMRLLNGNADCLGIVAVILLALHEGLHILRSDDLDRVTLGLKNAAASERHPYKLRSRSGMVE